MNAVERHPQAAQIKDAILSGKSLRAIAATLEPVLHTSTLSRFRATLIAPAVKAMCPRSESVRNVKVLASTVRTDTGAVVRSIEPGIDLAHEAAVSLARQDIEHRIEKRFARREGWIAQAERDTLVDKDGNTYIVMNHKALAAHDRNEGSDIEVIARIRGVLQGDATPVQQVAVFVLPGQPEAAGGQVIDIEATR